MKNKITLDVHLSGVDEATEKAVALREKIEEARTLARELASMMGEIKINCGHGVDAPIATMYESVQQAMSGTAEGPKNTSQQ